MKVLSPAEFKAATWSKLKAHYEERLVELRAKNDTDLDPDKTARLRGRIEEVKYLLDLATPDPVIEAVAGPEY